MVKQDVFESWFLFKADGFNETVIIICEAERSSHSAKEKK